MKRRLLHFLHVPLLAVPLAFSPLTAAAQSQSFSELLEKGIYTEETKGDIDAAISIYQQLVTEAKSAQALAAEAQFRIGQCYLKKNRINEATAAFERVIKEFPEQKELVAQARKHVPGQLKLNPAPWADGELLHLGIKLAGGLDIGAMAYHAKSADLNGQKAWQVGLRTFAKVHSASRVNAAWDDFHPLSSWWKHGLLGEVTANYNADSVELKTAGQSETKKVPLEGSFYDNEQVVHLIRRLPLEVGYKTTIPVVSTLAGGSLIPIPIEVKAKEPIEVPAGKWEAFKVELPTVAQAFWFSTDEKRYAVRFEGGGVHGELIAIEQRKPGESVRLEDKELQMALTAPEGWLIHKQDPDSDPNTSSFYLLDPDANTEGCFLKVHTLSSLPEDQQKSPRAWADGSIAKFTKAFKDLQVRKESWKELTVDGKPAVSCLADYKEGSKPMVLAMVCAIGSDQAQQFALMCGPTQFDALKPAFDSIVASYKSAK